MTNFPLKLLIPEVALPEALAGVEITDITLDSRKVREGSLFFALQGAQCDGKTFIAKAFAAGAVVALTESEDGHSKVKEGAGWVVSIPDLAGKVSEIAARFYGLPGQELRTIGVTGTNGKTTCSQLLARLYFALGERSAVLGTLGYGAIGGSLVDTGMTTPDAIQTQKILRELRQRHVRHLAMEVSSHALAQRRVSAVPIATAIFTNLTRDHLDFHGDMKTYGEAKLALFRQLGLARGVINVDDPFSKTILTTVKHVPLITYSIHSAEAMVRAQDVIYHDAGIQASLITPWGKGELRSRLIGEFNLSNILAVISAACAEGFSLHEVLAAAATLEPVPGRMQRVDVLSDVQVVVDYAHTPDALRAVLSAARLHCKGKLWSVFGCGGDRDKGKRPEMAKVSEQFADQSIVTSDNPRTEEPKIIVDEIVKGFSGAADFAIEVDRKLAIFGAVERAEPGDMIVVAGKGHEDYQIIGSKKFPFSDIALAREALQKRSGGAKQ